MPNRLTGDTAIFGDVLLANAKLDKGFRIRLGVGGVAITSSSEQALTGPFAALPAQAVINDCFLNVLVGATGGTKSISVGLLSTSSGGNRSGFLSAAPVGTTGLSLGFVAAGTSGGGTYGAFLSISTTGNAPVQREFASDSVTAKTLSITPGSTDWIGGVFSADLYVYYTDLTR